MWIASPSRPTLCQYRHNLYQPRKRSRENEPLPFLA
jgi:hypothetical protein